MVPVRRAMSHLPRSGKDRRHAARVYARPRLGRRVAGRAAAHPHRRGDRRRPAADARRVRPRDARARLREPRAGLLRPRARRGAGPAQDADRARPQHGVLDHRRQRRAVHARSASRSRARSPALYGEPDASRCWPRSRRRFLLTSLGATQQSLLLRDMDFRRLETLTVVGELVGAAAAVVLAARAAAPGRSSASSSATAAVTSAAAVARVAVAPAADASRAASMRDLGGFTGYLVGHRLLFYLHQNADRFLIGRFIGTAALGAYAVAYNVMLAAGGRIAGPVQRVLRPRSRGCRTSPSGSRPRGRGSTRLVGAIVDPVARRPGGRRAGLRPRRARRPVGRRGPVIQILAWVGILQALQTINIDILMARDRTSTLFRYSIVFFVAHMLAFVDRPAVGHHRRRRRLRDLEHARRAGADVLTARALGVSPLVFVRSVPASSRPARDGRRRAGRAAGARRRRRARGSRGSRC